MPTSETDPIERDRDAAWALFEAKPDHPEVGRLAARVLAHQPQRNGVRMLLAMHHRACGERDRARELFLEVVGARDAHFVNAARDLRDVELYESNYDEARRWAEAVLSEDQEGWHDWIQLGAARAMGGEMEEGWQLLDHGVQICADTDADRLPLALAARALTLLQSWAPAERFAPAAEEAMRADPSSDYMGGPLAWALLGMGKFDEAEELALRLLRNDPTDDVSEGVVLAVRGVRAAVEDTEFTLADVFEAGAVTKAWTQMRDQILGTDLASALAALDEVLPEELRASLRPPLDEEAASNSPGEREIAAWHDGQEPGTGGLWGVDGNFRLMSSAEITAMDEAMTADPDAFPEWRDEVLDDYYVQVMTDDDGGYLISRMNGVTIRRAGAEDVVVADSLTDWFWERVAAFGGRDPRPRPAAGGDA